MKKVFPLFILFFNLFSVLQSQNDMDVLRYSQPTIGGDARFMALGGSMGALGANLSCVNFNPAGIGLYRKGEFNASLGFQATTCGSIYNSASAEDVRSNLFIGSLAAARAVEEDSPFKDETSRNKFKNWSRRHVIGISYHKLAQFQQNVTIRGNAYQQSIINDFLGSAQNYAPSQLNPFFEGMAFNTYLIDTFPGSLIDYGTYFYLDKSFSHQKTIKTTGGINSFGLNYAYALDNKHYFGGSLGVLSGKWNYDSTFEELDYGDSTEFFKSLKLTEVIQTRSIGINLKLGAISRLNEFVRIGAYVHTPTVLSLNDAYSNRLEVSYDSLFGQRNVFLSDSSGPGTFRYKITSPLRAGISAAFIYKKYFSINVDAEYLNYANGKISSKTYTFEQVNEEINQKYIGVVNYKFGLECNFSPVVFRVGFATLGSPFGNSFSGTNSIQQYSAGIGLNLKQNRFLDFALVYKNRRETYYLFQPANVNPADLKFGNFILMATYVIRY